MSNKRREEETAFHAVEAERDLAANWEVDLSRKLEDYLFKICSGEYAAMDDDFAPPLNFAEAALLLQGSVRVYSRKVEYLYNLVLHAFEFLSQTRQQESETEGASDQQEQRSSRNVGDEDNDQFWVSDDIPVEPRNCLDASTSKDSSHYNFVKPPSNLVVLEGDCLDTTCDNGELESYLLATTSLYRNFILLDPCDAETVNDFLKNGEAGKGQTYTHRATSSRKKFQSPSRCSGGTAGKASNRKDEGDNPHESSAVNRGCGVGDSQQGPESNAFDNFDDYHDFDTDNGFPEPGNLADSDSEDDDPWKPLNPHETGNLKVKPFKKVKACRRKVLTTKQTSLNALFPPAKLNGTISPELTEMWEALHGRNENREKSKSSLLYEKLRQSLVNGEPGTSNSVGNPENVDDDNGFDDWGPNFDQPDGEISDTTLVDEGLGIQPEKHDGAAASFDNKEAFGMEDPSSQASLEDLCRSHLDALLAKIAETEKQTELATRVSTWKQKIERNLEDQDCRLPFDIHAYGERIMGKFSLEADENCAMSFADIVKGQEKHDVTRSFSALLQLVNNGNVDLDKSGFNSEPTCYTGSNPFSIRLLGNGHNKKPEEAQLRFSKKRLKSPLRKKCNKAEKGQCVNESNSSSLTSPQPNGNFSVNLGKLGRCTPESKRRRKSRIIERPSTVNLSFPG